MNKNIKDIFFFGIIFLIVDQAIKIFISSKMTLYQSTILIKEFLSITFVHNTGAAFSILNGGRIFLVVVGLLVLLGLIIYIVNLKNVSDIEAFIYSLLIGGIAGNLVDRIIHGYVIDYLSVKIGNYYFPIFNFADICIVVAVIFIALNLLRGDLWKK